MLRRSAIWGLAALGVACGEAPVEPMPEDCPPDAVEVVDPMWSGELPLRFDPFQALADPDLPARRLPGEVFLAASWAPTSPVDVWRNDDHNHFQSESPGRRVLLEDEGPGFLTRIWLTVRAMEDGGPFEPSDELVLHFIIDGEEVDFGGGGGIPLAELLGGEHPALPAPWAADRDLASNAYMLSVPIAYQDDIVVYAEDDTNLTFYYQIEYRRLCPGTEVRSFDGTLTETEQRDLDAATALWVDGIRPEPERATATLAIDPGATESFAVTGPTVVRWLTARTDPPFYENLDATLTVDGEVIATAPLEQLLYGAQPSAPYRSALSAMSETGELAFGYPAPTAERFTLSLTNVGDDAVSVDLGAHHDPSAYGDRLGKLRVTCDVLEPEEQHTGMPVLSIEGTRGQYAGQFLIMRGDRFGWWMMEGDHRMRVDGDWTVLGTGTEDYIGGSFYFLGGPFTLPTSGATGWDFPDGGEHLTAPLVDVSMYRHHLLGTVPFQESFLFEYEVVVNMTDYEYCAVWYEFSGGSDE